MDGTTFELVVLGAMRKQAEQAHEEQGSKQHFFMASASASMSSLQLPLVDCDSGHISQKENPFFPKLLLWMVFHYSTRNPKTYINIYTPIN